MLQHPIIRYAALSLSLAFISVSALAQSSVGERPEIYNIRPQTILGPQSAPRCQLTNAATILVNAAVCAANPTTQGVNLNSIILTQNSVYAFPTGLPAGGNFQFGFRIDHGSGPFTATFAPGYSFPAASMTNGQPNLSTGIDFIWCTSEVGATVVDCIPSMLNMTAVTTSVVLQAKGAGPTTATTNAIDTTGMNLYVLVGTCNGATLTASDSVGGAWTAAQAAISADGIAYIQMFYKFAPTTSATYTASISCNGASSFATAELTAWNGGVASPLDHVNNNTSSGSNVTSISTGSTGTLSQAGELIVAGIIGLGTNDTITSIDSGFSTPNTEPYTAGTNFAGASSYLLQPTTAAVNPTWQQSVSSAAAAEIASFR